MSTKVTYGDLTEDFIIKDKTGVEGGYVNDPNDPGGETNHGITKATADQYKSQLVSQFGWDGQMKDLTEEMAIYIYKVGYWDKMKLDDVWPVNHFLADRMFDLGINAGPGVVVKNLQNSLNVLNNGGTYYADISVDGAMGPGTLGALNSYAAKRGQEGLEILVDMMFSLHGSYYINLSISKESDEKYTYGWESRVRGQRERFEAITLNGFSVE